MTPFLDVVEKIFHLDKAVQLLLVALAISIAVSPFRSHRTAQVSQVLSFLVSILFIGASLKTLLIGDVESYVIRIPLVPTTKPIDMSRIVLELDYLSAFFVLLLSIVVLAASLFGIQYVSKYRHEQHLGWYSLNYVLFVSSMYLVLLVRDLLWFVVFWELMTVSSQYLVSFEKEKIVARRAGFKYFSITKFGAEAILVSAVVLTLIIVGSTAFNDVSAYLRYIQTSAPILYWILTSLFMLGLLIKCASVPFHGWLPEAHPEAPSNVSALLSGAMIKMPIYMMIRILFEFSKPSILWGFVISTLGCITLVVGTMYALVQIDSKRLLAYHSVGQIGYILLALGAALYLYSFNKAMASIALLACLYHALNHALFKSNLFLVAGSVEFSTGSRNLDILGGLGRTLRSTAVSGFIASMSIAGVPPFNGFVSKWLIYISTMLSRSFLALYGALAFFISAVTTASFVKFYAKLFTGTPRPTISVEKKPGLTMKVAEMILSMLCIALGVLPLLFVVIATKVVETLGLDPSMVSCTIATIMVDNTASLSMLLFVVVLTTFVAVTVPIASGKPYGTPWKAGMPMSSMYVARARDFYRSFEEVFHEVYTVGAILAEVFYRRFRMLMKKIFRDVSLSLEDPHIVAALFIAVTLAIALIGVFSWIR